MDFEPNWKPPSNEPRFDICNAIVNEALRVVSTEASDLIDLFPFRNSAHTQIRLAAGWIGLMTEFAHAPGIPSIDDLTPAALPHFQAAAELTLEGSHRELRAALGSHYFS